MPGQVDSHRKKNKRGPLSHIILKKKITQKGSDLNIKARCIQFLEENTGGNFSGLRFQLQLFLRDNTKSSSNQRQIRLYQILKTFVCQWMNSVGHLGGHLEQKMKLDPNLTSHPKNKPKQIKEFSVKKKKKKLNENMSFLFICLFFYNSYNGEIFLTVIENSGATWEGLRNSFT